MYCDRRQLEAKEGHDTSKCIVTKAARLGRGNLYRNTNWASAFEVGHLCLSAFMDYNPTYVSNPYNCQQLWN